MKRWYWSLVLAAPLMAGMPVDKIDTGESTILHGSGGSGAPQLLQAPYTPLFTDTAMNQYTVWSNTQRNLFAKGDTLVACYRRMGDGSLGSGAIALAWSVDGGQTWTRLWPINDASVGGSNYVGRYPHAVLGDVPGCGWAELASGGWGYEGAVSAAWDGSAFQGEINTSVNDEVHKHIAYPLGGSWIGAAFGAGATPLYVTDFDPAGGFFNNIQASALSSMSPGVFRAGLDGNLYLFGVDQVSSEFAFVMYDANAGDFSSTPTLFQPATPPSIVGYDWMDGLVLGNGDAVLAISGYTDAAFTLSNALFVYRYEAASGTTSVVRVDDPNTTHYIHYPNLIASTDGSALALLWAQADTALDQNIGGFHWDIYVSFSEDGGATWTPPQLISDTAVTEYSPHVNGYFVRSGNDAILTYLFGTSADTTQYPNWDGFWQVLDTVTNALVPTQINIVIDTVPMVSVEESTPVRRQTTRMVVDLSARAFILYAPVEGVARVEILDMLGRRVMERTLTVRGGEGRTDIGELAKGTYLVRVSLPNGKQVNGKIWVAR